MQCKCGGIAPTRVHKVESSAGADKWAEGLWSSLPLTVVQNECGSCGRLLAKVFDGDRLIKTRG